jgi:hypothetical protein
VDLLGRSGSPLVYEPERVPETSPCLGLRYDPEPDLVAHEHNWYREVTGAQQELVKLGQRSSVGPGRHPEREGVEQDRIPPVSRLQDFAQFPDLQCAPPTRPALCVESDAPPEVVVFSDEGRCHVEYALPSEGRGQTLGEVALSASGASKDEGANGYSSSLISARS